MADSTSEEPLLKREETSEVKDKMYRTKRIQFLGRNTPIILQNENGPCPLLAICNILSLRNKLGLSPDVTEVSQTRLLTLVAERLIASNSNNNETESVEYQVQHVSNALAILPSFATGIDVNIKFTSIDDFEFTRERAIFDMLEIPLYHGWLVDPTDSDTSNAIGSKSYNTVVEELVSVEHQNMDALKLTETTNPFLTGDESTSNIKCNDDWVTFDPEPVKDLCSFLEAGNTSHGQPLNVVQESPKGMTAGITAIEGELIRSFLRENASQLTPYGLYRLQNDLKEGVLCVFFRNNHFNTMFKYGGTLYTLVTAEGYINTPGVVWEKLNEVRGDTIFANSYFMSFKKSTNEIVEISSSDDDEIVNLAKVFQYIAKADKTAAEESSSKNPDVKFAEALEKQEFKERPTHRAKDFLSVLVVAPEQEYSPWPRQRDQSSITKRPKEGRRLKAKLARKFNDNKDKCTSM